MCVGVCQFVAGARATEPPQNASGRRLSTSAAARSAMGATRNQARPVDAPLFPSRPSARQGLDARWVRPARACTWRRRGAAARPCVPAPQGLRLHTPDWSPSPRMVAAAVAGWAAGVRSSEQPKPAPSTATPDHSNHSRARDHVARRGPARIVSARDVLLALARHFALLDVVVMLDGAMHLGCITHEELTEGLKGRRHGVRRLREAASLADARSESPFETLLRVLHVVCEVAVIPQHELRVAGQLVARGDLRIRRHPYLPVVQRAGHRDRDQHRSDLRRDRDIAAAGWLRRGYTDLEVLRRPIEITA